jgi:hypothetical protein
MMWRLDLTKYEDVKANAAVIYAQIQAGPSQGGMPPLPYPPLTDQQIGDFKRWMDGGFPA